MRLIAGLGNPGPEYALTRHNAGWSVIDHLADRLNAGSPQTKFGGGCWSLTVDGEKVFLLKPYTYMNESGVSVGALARFYRLVPSEILVVVDDINLPLGRMRIRTKGSAGGHNGLKSIIAHLGSQDFSRLRLGVDPPPPGYDLAAWVLGSFSSRDRQTMDEVVERASEFCAQWITSSTEKLMNRVNSCDLRSQDGGA